MTEARECDLIRHVERCTSAVEVEELRQRVLRREGMTAGLLAAISLQMARLKRGAA